MKPVHLEFCGINSFSERAEIDFRSLLEFGLFGIFGDTGSGKSTVLDCICFALYGDVTRLSSKTAGLADFINYKCDRAYVHFTFELDFDGRKTFRVEREIRRRSSGAHNVKVFEIRPDGAQLAIAEGVRDCKIFLENLIGLEQSDFEKCIALPQGEFAQFVKSTPSERLRIVSRLFDLERYGAALSKRAGERYSSAKKSAEIVAAKLGMYAEVSKERNGALQEEIVRLGKEETEQRAALDVLRERERLAAEAEKKREEAKRLNARREQLNAQREEAEKLERELSRLEGAAAVVQAEKERTRAREALELARRTYAAAQRRAESTAAELKEALGYDAERAEAEIVRLTELRAASAAAEEKKKRRSSLEARLREIRADFAQETENFRGFSYEAEREAIERELLALGEGDLAAYTERIGKASLFRGEYAEFRGELVSLTEKHAQIEADTRPLIQKYGALATGGEADFAQIKADFEARERARAAAQKRLLDLEKRNSGYKVHCERLQLLETQGGQIKKELEGLGEETPLPPLSETERELARIKREKAEKSAAAERAREVHAKSGEELAAAKERGQNLAQTAQAAEERLQERLRAGEFSGAEEAARLVVKYGDAGRAREKLNAYKEETVSVNARLQALGELPAEEPEGLAALRARLKECEEHCTELHGALALKRDELTRGEKALDEKRALEAQSREAEREATLYERLKKLLDGNKFMEFVAEEHLQTVALNASVRLLSLTDGRYFLRYDRGFFVGDNYNGGRLRGVYTLSGGETFLVSLSLALALSQEICARSLRPIEFFFLDEGFGTLDERLVDTVMNSLEKLKGEHFSIGIISHVEELKHRIDRKLLVRKATESRGSQIETE